MNDNCPICFENLSISAFQEGTTELVIHNDCSRLTCGHGFHTKCLIQALSSTRGCPLCRMVDDEVYNQDPRLRAQQRLHMQTYCDTILDKIKNEVLTEHLKDYKAFTQELEEKRKVFKQRVADFKEGLRTEMNIEPILQHINKVKTDTKRKFHREVKKRGGIFTTVLQRYYTCHSEERLLFNERSPWYFSHKNKRDFW